MLFIVRGKRQAVQISGPVVKCNTGSILYAFLPWCDVVQERSIEGVGDGMVEGGAALGMGIYRGFTGLVTKPVEGAKSKGVGGAVECTAACLVCMTCC